VRGISRLASRRHFTRARRAGDLLLPGSRGAQARRSKVT
jgi:hypothetical protein